MNLLPQDEKFFDLLAEQARIVSEASGELAGGLGSTAPAESRATARKVRDLERTGDVLRRQIYRRLHKTFITPIDPEDIHQLATKINEILDHLEGVAFRFDSYSLDRSPQYMAELAGIVHRCVEATRGAIETLQRNGVKEPDELTKCCEEIHWRELAAEDRVREIIRDLFATERDPIMLIKQKEIYELLESTAHCCENVADVLEAIAVKNS